MSYFTTLASHVWSAVSSSFSAVQQSPHPETKPGAVPNLTSDSERTANAGNQSKITPLRRKRSRSRSEEPVSSSQGGRKRRKKNYDTPVQSIEDSVLYSNRGTDEGPTSPDILDQDSSPIGSSRSQYSSPQSPSDDDANDDGSETLTGAAFDAERQNRKAEMLKFSDQHKDWPEEDRRLFHQLSMRGFEPLLPLSWEYDFKILPLDLFAGHASKPPIRELGLDNNKRTAEFRGRKAFARLLEAGNSVRANLRSKSARSPEAVLGKEVQAYWEWALRDAGLKPYAGLSLGGKRTGVDVLAIEVGGTETSARRLQARILRKFARLQRAWEKWASNGTKGHRLPLYGVVISHSVLAIVSYKLDDELSTSVGGSPGVNGSVVKQEEEEDPDASIMSTTTAGIAARGGLRIIALFDFQKGPYDVWNAFAVAILICHCRRVLLEAMDAEEMYAKITIEGLDESEDDPDV